MRQMRRRRDLLVIGLGISFLVLMTWLGTLITSIVPHKPTAQVQTASVGPYQATLQVDPNPPLITQPATLSVRVILNSSQQPITSAHVTIEGDMEAMDMGLDKAEAQSRGDGLYEAKVQFTMSGPWRVQLVIAAPGNKPVSMVFEVTVQ